MNHAPRCASNHHAVPMGRGTQDKSLHPPMFLQPSNPRGHSRCIENGSKSALSKCLHFSRKKPNNFLRAGLNPKRRNLISHGQNENSGDAEGRIFALPFPCPHYMCAVSGLTGPREVWEGPWPHPRMWPGLLHCGAPHMPGSVPGIDAQRICMRPSCCLAH